jgi:hypothetical protein
MKTTTTSAVIVAGLVLAVFACSEEEQTPSPPCDTADPKSCPEGQACSNTIAASLANECVPVLCNALHGSCCWLLPQADREACAEIAKSKSLEACAQETRTRNEAGFCVKDPEEERLCNTAACDLNPFELGHSDRARADCCTGTVCIVTDPEEVSGPGTCEQCVGEDTACEPLKASRCCPGLRCDPYSKTCRPLVKAGESCNYSFDCEDGLTCDDEKKCVKETAPPPSSSSSSSSSSGSSSGTTGCDPASCSGTQGSCSGGFCFFCTYYCEGNACQQRCTE